MTLTWLVLFLFTGAVAYLVWRDDRNRGGRPPAFAV